MKRLWEGKRLKPKEHIRDWEGSLAVVSHYGQRQQKWLIIIDDNFTAWYTPEEAEKDFEEF